jgi:GNAT superfamily N-acetyltransferase
VSVSIREATADDVDAVLALWEVAADPGRTLIDEPADLRRLIASPSGTLLIADVDSRPVGTIVAGWDGWRGNLYRLVVAGEHRRQGVATQLVARAEEVLQAHGCPRITALVHMALAEAPSFWPALGYRLDADVGRFVRNLG